MGETPAPLPSLPLRAAPTSPRTQPPSVLCVLLLWSIFPCESPPSLLPLPRLSPPARPSTPLPVCPLRFACRSRSRTARVKSGAVPGRDGAEGRGWGRRGGGAQARGGGQRRAPRRPCVGRLPRTWRRRSRAGSPPPPGILAPEKPGSPGREEEVPGVPPRPPTPRRSRPRPAHLGSRGTLPRTACDSRRDPPRGGAAEFPGLGRTFPGWGSRGTPPPQLPRCSPGTGGAAGRL